MNDFKNIGFSKEHFTYSAHRCECLHGCNVLWVSFHNIKPVWLLYFPNNWIESYIAKGIQNLIYYQIIIIKSKYKLSGFPLQLRKMGAIASQITSLTIVYSIVYSDADQRNHQSSASLAFVWGIHRGPVNSPHKWPITRKMFSFDDVIMQT